MRVKIPTSWIRLVVQRTTHQLTKTNDTQLKLVFTLDGHDVNLLQDGAPSGEPLRRIIADLKVGDQLKARGILLVKPHLNRHNKAGLRLYLHVHEVRALKRRFPSKHRSRDSARDESEIGGSDSQVRNSEEQDLNSTGRSSIIKRAKREHEAKLGDKRSSEGSSSDLDESSQWELLEERNHPYKKCRTTSARSIPMGPSEASGRPNDTDKESAIPEDSGMNDSNSQESFNSNCQDGVDGDSQQSTESNRQEGADTDSQQSTDSDSQEGADSDSPQSTESNSQQSTDSDSPQSTESDSQEGADSDSPQGTESDSQEGADSDSPQGTESDSQEGADSDSQQSTDSDSPQSTDSDCPQSTESDSQQRTDSDSPQSTESDSQQSTDSDSQQSTDSDSLQSTESDSQDDVNGGSLSLVQYAERGAVPSMLELEQPRFTSRGSAPSWRHRRNLFDTYAEHFVFNGRGQPVGDGLPLREISESDLVYVFSQVFNNRTRREIWVTTRMAETESVDRLIVRERLHDASGLVVQERVLT